MDATGHESIELHKQQRGKLEIKSKVPLQDKHDLSLAYTPGVAAVSSAIGSDKALAKTLTMKGNSVAVVSDGSAILGLGNLGPEAALPVMEGKAILFKEFAGIDAFPICLATQDTEEIIKAVQLIAPVFGGVNLEDIAAPRCFEIEHRLRETLDIPVMHDDQHGTATVILAALINALKLRRNDKSISVVINGAGAAGVAITNLLVMYGFTNLIVCDSKGTIAKSRTELNAEKQIIADTTNPKNISGGLAEAVAGADVFIGVSKPGLLTTDLVQTMNQRPVIFALANPVPEIMPDEAKKAGAFTVATGRSDFPNQINNVLAFPGIFRGALDNNVTLFTSEMFIRAAEALADYVKNPTTDQLLPQVFDKGVVLTVARAIH